MLCAGKVVCRVHVAQLLQLLEARVQVTALRVERRRAEPPDAELGLDVARRARASEPPSPTQKLADLPDRNRLPTFGKNRSRKGRFTANETAEIVLHAFRAR